MGDERLAALTARVELLELVVLRLIEHRHTVRFEELKDYVRADCRYYADHDTLPGRTAELLDEWRDEAAKAGGDDASA